MKITTSKERITISTLKMLIFGQSGMGKTTLAASAEKAIVLDFDKGAERLVRNYDFVTFENYEDLTDALSLPANFADYKTVIIDTVGELYSEVIVEKLKRSGLWDNTKSQPKLQGGWNALENLYREIHYKLDALGLDVIFLAHETLTRPKMGESDKANPEIDKRIFNIIKKTAHQVGYLYANATGERMLDFRPDPSHFSKDSAQIKFVKILNLHPDNGQTFPNQFPELIAKMKENIERNANKNVDLELYRLQALNESVTDAATVNAALKEVLTYKGDEYYLGRLKGQLNGKAKKLGLSYSETTKQFEPSQPVNKDEIEDPTTN